MQNFIKIRICLTKFIKNHQNLKKKYGISSNSATSSKKGNTFHFGRYSNFEYWKKRWGWDFDNPVWLEKWAETDVEDAWNRYWKTYADMAESGLFDILAHPDLIKKFGYRPSGNLSRYYEPVIDAIATCGCAIEINTAGWHKPCEEAYPSLDFLDLACSAGIPLVISSDAHKPAELGRDFDQAKTLAKQAGYSETLLFENHRRSFETL